MINHYMSCIRRLMNRVPLRVHFILGLICLSAAANAQINLTATAGTTSATYTTLRDAFDAINDGTHQGAIVISLTGDVTEIATAQLNPSGEAGASYTGVRIIPSGGAMRTISGDMPGTPLIDINGGDNVVIDGLNSGGNGLTIKNTSTSSGGSTHTIRFQNDAVGDTVTRCTVLGASSNISNSAASGTIFFGNQGSAANAGGNDNNVISFCNIGPLSSSQLPSRAIASLSAATLITQTNSGNQIINNNIYDYFAGGGPSHGIFLSSLTGVTTVSNNRFYQTAARVQTTGALHTAINLNSGQLDNSLIQNNIIGYSSVSGTGSYTVTLGSSSGRFAAICGTSGSTVTPAIVDANTITALNITATGNGTGTSSPLNAIAFTSGIANVTNNIIGGTTSSTHIQFSSTLTTNVALDAYGILMTQGNATLSGNTIGGIQLSTPNISTTAGQGLFGIKYNNSTALSSSLIQNNTIGFVSAPLTLVAASSPGSQCIGIYNTLGAASITGNTVRYLVSNAPNVGTDVNAAMIGILTQFTTGTPSAINIISNNEVYAITSNAASTAAVTLTGIAYAGPAGLAASSSVEKNRIYAISGLSTVASAAVIGINTIATGLSPVGSGVRISNNFISLGLDKNGNSIGNHQIIGINEGTGLIWNNTYHNSVYIGGTVSTGGPASTFAFRSLTTSTSARFVKNNIFYNDRTNSGSSTSKHYAVSLPVTHTGLTMDFNLLSGSITGLYNATDRITISDWRSATGKDLNSQTGNPQFVNATTFPPDLHINTGTGSLAESTGSLVAEITDDYDNQSRAGLTPVDIGADAFIGISEAPVFSNFSLTPPGNQCAAVAHVLSIDITTPSGTISTVKIVSSFNGITQPDVILSNTTGNTWTGTIPPAVPSNATVTYSVVAASSAGVTNIFVGTPYKDDYLAGHLTTGSATPSSVCAGSTTSLAVSSSVSSAGIAFVGVPDAMIGSATGNLLRTGVSGTSTSRTQCLWRASELQAAGILPGNITSLTFNVISGGGPADYTFRMGNVSASSLTVVFDPTPLTTVASFIGFNTVPGPNTFTFSTPFTWDGVSNIVVEVCAANASGVVFVQATNTAYASGSNLATTNACAALVTSNATVNQRPVIGFGGNIGQNLTNSMSWTWNPSAISGNPAMVSPAASGNYTVTGTDINGCTVVSGPVAVTVNAIPDAPVTTASSQCGSQIPTASVLSSTPGVNYKWYTAATGGTLIQNSPSTTLASYIVSSTSTLYVSAADGTTGCESARVPVLITVTQPDSVAVSVSAGPYCPGIQLTLNATQVGTTNTYTYTWNGSAGAGLNSNSGTTVTANPTGAGLKTYTLTATDGSCTYMNTVSITMNNSPVLASLTATPATICLHDSTVLTATSNVVLPGTKLLGTQALTSGFASNPYQSNIANQERKVQVLLRASELTALGFVSGNITSLGLTTTGTVVSSFNNFSIKMAQVSSSVAALNQVYLTPAFTTVYSVPFFAPVVGLNTHTFTTPFNWDGTSNIVIEFCQTNNAPIVTVNLAFEVTAYVSTIQNQAINGCSALNGVNGVQTGQNVRPLITLGGQLTQPVTNGLTYTWNPGAYSVNPIKVSPTDTTAYTVIGTDITGCTVTGNITVNVAPLFTAPTAIAGTQCGFGRPTCKVASTSGVPAPQFAWFTASNGGTAIQTGTADSLTSYTISATTTFYVGEKNVVTGCIGDRVAVTQTVTQPDSVGITATALSLCQGESSIITAVQSGSVNSYTYSWNVTPSVGSGLSGLAMNTPTTVVNTNFSTLPSNVTLQAPASITNAGPPVTNLNYLRLTPPTSGNQNGAMSVTSAGNRVDSLSVAFNLYIPSAGATGEGFSWSFADDGSLFSGTPIGNEAGTGSKLAISFDVLPTLPNTAGIYLMYNPVSGPAVNMPSVLAYSTDMTWRTTTSVQKPVLITIDRNSRLSMTFNGTPIFTNVQLPQAYVNANKANWTHYFKGRSATATGICEFAIDDLNIQVASLGSTVTGNPLSFSPTTAGTYNLQVIAQDASNNCAYTNTTTIVKNASTPAVKASSDQSVCPGANVVVSAASSALVPAVRFTEILPLINSGTNPPLSFPSFISSWIGTDNTKDMIEITNLSQTYADITGLNIEWWTGSSITVPTRTLPIPSNASLVPPGGNIFVSFGPSAAPASVIKDTVNNFYTGHINNVSGSGSDMQPTTPYGFVIRKGSVIVDAVAVMGYAFPAASGVTTADWSGTMPSNTNLSGNIMVKPDNNTANAWQSTSGNFRGNPGILNSGLNLNLSPTGVINWTSIPAGLTASTPIATLGPVNGPTQIIASYTDGTCTSYDTLMVTLQSPDVPEISASEDSLCMSGSTVLTITDYNPSFNYLWLKGPSVNGPWTAISGTSGSTYSPNLTAVLDDSTAYFRVVGTCGTFAGDTSLVLPVFISNPTITSATGASRCGYGSVQLNVTSGPGHIIRWYDAANGGSLVNTGASFTTPNLSSTTTYYVDARSASGNDQTSVSPVPNFSQAALGSGIQFTLTQNVMLNSVQIYSSTEGTATISLLKNDLTILYTISGINITASGPNIPQTINLGWYIPADLGYRLLLNSTASEIMMTQAGLSFPYSLGNGVGTITAGVNANGLTNTNNYYNFYSLSTSTGCFSPRTPVTATITPAPSITVLANDSSVCSGQSVNLSVNSSNDPSYTYVWSNGFTGAAQTVSPTFNTTYSVVATDNTSGPNAGCAYYGSLNIKANAAPSVPVITQNPVTVCGQVPVTLTASSDVPAVVQVGTDVQSISFPGITPYNSFYEGQKIQYLIRGNELAASGLVAGPITGMAFNVISAPGGTPQNGFEIKMKNSNQMLLSTFETGLSSVFIAPSPGVMPVTGWNNYAFNTPFVWDGTSSIVVEVCHNNNPTGSCLSNCSASGSSIIEYTSTSYTSVYGVYGNNTTSANPWDLCSGISTGTVRTAPQRPNMRFVSGVNPNFLWSTGETTNNIIVTPPAGSSTYTVTATNFNGCTSQNMATITTSPTPSPYLTPNDTTVCFGTVLQIAVQDSGFYAAGYPAGTTVDWIGIVNGLPPTATMSSDNGQFYQVRVTLPSGCTATSAIRSIVTRTVLTSQNIVSPSCSGSPGSISVLVTDGTAPFRFVWKDANTNTVLRDTIINSMSNTLGNLGVGNYTLEITDMYPSGCSSGVIPYTLTVASAPSLTVNASTLTCFGYTDGSATAIGSGGTGTLTYLWENGSTNPTRSNLGAGTYTVTVTDAGGCSATQSTTITQPDEILATVTLTSPDCAGAATGSVSAVVTGGTLPYSNSEWYDSNVNPVSTGLTATGLVAGDYQLFVNDANGCMIMPIYTLSDPAALAITSFTPGSGATGTVVTITGTSFTGAGNVSFNGTSASFTVVSSTEISATVPAAATTGLISVTTTCGTVNSATSFTVTPTATLNLHALVEGYYNGAGQMRPVLMNQGVSAIATESDSMTIELRDPMSPSTVVASRTSVLSLGGTANYTIPSSLIGQNLYIVLRHRNGIETWSALPVSITAVTSYDFTTAATQAYGSNMRQMAAGVYAIYSGDFNHDLSVDGSDFLLMDTDIQNFGGGWIATDLNGDGSVDGSDFLILDNNIQNFVGGATP